MLVVNPWPPMLPFLFRSLCIHAPQRHCLRVHWPTHTLHEGTCRNRAPIPTVTPVPNLPHVVQPHQDLLSSWSRWRPLSCWCGANGSAPFPPLKPRIGRRQVRDPGRAAVAPKRPPTELSERTALPLPYTAMPLPDARAVRSCRTLRVFPVLPGPIAGSSTDPCVLSHD